MFNALAYFLYLFNYLSRNRLRQYPSLINCTTIDWFLEWPKEALLEVGMKYLNEIDFAATITGQKAVGLCL